MLWEYYCVIDERGDLSHQEVDVIPGVGKKEKDLCSVNDQLLEIITLLNLNIITK
jgi:hypothetical protein